MPRRFAEHLARPSRPGPRPLCRGVRGGAGSADRRPEPAAARSLRHGRPPRRPRPPCGRSASPIISRIIATVRGWQAGRLRALRSERARELMGQMLPALLAALGAQPHPDVAFGRFDALLAACPPGVQLLSMFQRNPALLRAGRRRAGRRAVARRPSRPVPAALEGLLAPEDRRTPAATAQRAAAPTPGSSRTRSRSSAAPVREEDFALRSPDGGLARRGRRRAAAHRAGRRRARRAAAARARAISPRATGRSAAARWRWWRSARRAAGR